MNDAVKGMASVLCNQALQEMIDVSLDVESLARSLSEAAFRGHLATVRVHLIQLRASLIALIQTYNELERLKHVAAAAQRIAGHGDDHGSWHGAASAGLEPAARLRAAGTQVEGVRLSEADC